MYVYSKIFKENYRSQHLHLQGIIVFHTEINVLSKFLLQFSQKETRKELNEVRKIIQVVRKNILHAAKATKFKIIFQLQGN
jgi:hypothetical protein